MASPTSGSGGGVVPAVSSVGGSYYGSQHCYLPVTKKVDSLPRIGMLGGSTPGMYSVNKLFTLLSPPSIRYPHLSSCFKPSHVPTWKTFQVGRRDFAPLQKLSLVLYQTQL
ncbi:hypothetical protein TNIN_212701 [Trichonephila inaurata madagascariensis]|uniref:Uncharacterized protein n=1 Tax=Trichonephila inaurata madagascariensis TaxID=2747483 RepID=A0A8X6WX78_9ARAC|nr:hypothetical protein TNIN_212701 [Trichonephila inaurata madagascariensis]